MSIKLDIGQLKNGINVSIHLVQHDNHDIFADKGKSLEKLKASGIVLSEEKVNELKIAMKKAGFEYDETLGFHADANSQDGAVPGLVQKRCTQKLDKYLETLDTFV